MTKRTHSAVFTLLVFLSTAALSAKNNYWQQGEGNDRIQSLFFSFAAEKLNLTQVELERFIPVYKAYVHDLASMHSKYPPNTSLTAEQQIKLEQQKLALREKYIPQFRAALGAEKVNHLYSVERQFEEKLKQVRQERIQERNNSTLHPGAKR